MSSATERLSAKEMPQMFASGKWTGMVSHVKDGVQVPTPIGHGGFASNEESRFTMICTTSHWPIVWSYNTLS